MTKVVVLDTYSWDGVSAGAKHYYGELHALDIVASNRVHVNMKSIQLTQPRTPEIAADMNKYLREHYKDESGIFEVGEPEERFDSLADLKEYAVAHYKDYFPDAVLLFYSEGSLATVEPFLPLGWNFEYSDLVNELYWIFKVGQASMKQDDYYDEDSALDLVQLLYNRMCFLLYWKISIPEIGKPTKRK